MEERHSLRQPLVISCQSTEASGPCQPPLHDPLPEKKHEPFLRLGQFHDFEPHVLFSGRCQSVVSGVAPIDKCDFDALPGHRLHLLSESADLIPLLLVRGLVVIPGAFAAFGRGLDGASMEVTADGSEARPSASRRRRRS